MKLKKLFIPVVIIQLILVIFLGVKIRDKQQQVLGVSINPLLKENLLFPKNDDYKSFYEPDQGTSVESLSFMGINADATYKINDDGLNQIQNYQASKSAGIYRIITLGDSFTYGLHVNTQENYPSQLENLLNSKLKCKNIKKFEVLNLGVEGYDIAYSVERYKLRGQKYNPDLILWFLINDDFYRLNEALIPLGTKYLAEEQASGQYEKHIKSNEYAYAFHKAEDEIVAEAGGRDAVLKMQENKMNELKNYYKGPLLIFTEGVENSVSNLLQNFKENNKNTYLYLNIPGLIQEPAFPDGHPTAKGYSIIVNNLYNYITINNLIPCNK